MRTRHHLTSWQAYADVMMLLFGWAMMMVALMVVFFNIQNKENKDYHPKAEYMIVLDYDDNRNVDLDLWLKNQNGQRVFYRNKEVENVSLDRDTRGHISNESIGPDGVKIYSGNEEIITIRAIIPGATYQIAVSYYGCASCDDPPIDYTVKVIKVNPKLKVVFEEKKHMSNVKEVQRITTFTVHENGDVEIVPNSSESFLSQDELP